MITGRTTNADGYVELRIAGDPLLGTRRIYEHRYLVSHSLGRKLLRTEIVHHINENPSDNSLENLKLLPSQAAHRKIHGRPLSEARKQKIGAGISAAWTRRKASPDYKPRALTEEHKARISAANSRKIWLTCQRCHIAFPVSPSRAGRKHCSPECRRGPVRDYSRSLREQTFIPSTGGPVKK